MTVAKSKKPRQAATLRLTISFPSDLYAELERIAKRDKRSLGWVVRKAVEDLAKAEEPLLHQIS